MWIDQDLSSTYQGNGGAVAAIVEPGSRDGWHWKVGVKQKGAIRWALSGIADSRQGALNAAKSVIDMMETSLETGGLVSCGW